MNESGHKLNKIYVDQGHGFYNKSMKLWLHDNGTEIYSTHNEGNYVVIERFVDLKYKDKQNIFAKRCTPNRSEEVFLIKKVKNTVPWTYVISDLHDKEIIGTFNEKEIFVISRFSFTKIQGAGYFFNSSTSSTRFTDTEALAKRLIQRAHLRTYLAGKETFGFQAQVANH